MTSRIQVWCGLFVLHFWTSRQLAEYAVLKRIIHSLDTILDDHVSLLVMVNKIGRSFNPAH